MPALPVPSKPPATYFWIAVTSKTLILPLPSTSATAFLEVRWGKRPENIQVLEQAGNTVDKFGGEAFRAAVQSKKPGLPNVTRGHCLLSKTTFSARAVSYTHLDVYKRKR